MRAFILSAGLGTRLRPLSGDRPKVMIKIGGKPVLEHLLELCKKHQIRKIIINLYYFPDEIRNYFKNGKRWGVSISYSLEKKLKGGAGALKFAEKLIGKETLLVLNGDLLTNVDLTDMARFHRKRGGVGTVLIHKSDHPLDSDLVEYDKKQLITRFFRPKLGDRFVPISKSGVHIFEPEVLGYIPQGKVYFLEKDLIPKLIKDRRKLYAYYSEAYAKDMGTIKRLKQVREDYKRGLLKNLEIME